MSNSKNKNKNKDKEHEDYSKVCKFDFMKSNMSNVLSYHILFIIFRSIITLSSFYNALSTSLHFTSSPNYFIFSHFSPILLSLH